MGKVTSATDSGSKTARAHLPTVANCPLKTGKTYKLTCRVWLVGTFTGVAIRTSDVGGGTTQTIVTQATVGTTGSWQNLETTLVVGTDATGSIEIDGDSSTSGAQIFYFDDVSVVQIGAVAEYDGSGVTNTKWYDKSGNELHGTVTGATDENTAGAPVISENHPAFLVHPASTQSDIAVGSWVPVVFGTEVFDQGSNFASNTFTAPVTGKYQLNLTMRLDALDSASGYYQVRLGTSNRTYYSIIDPDFGQDAAYWSLNLAVLADMDVSDTASIDIIHNNGTQQTDIHTETIFSGYLVC